MTMKQGTSSPFIAAFILVSLADITGILFDIPLLQQVAKPLLMPVLLVWLLIFSSPLPYKWLLLSGLLFSWFGDIALMLEKYHALLFIAGLVCFLITHAFYIGYFLKQRSTAPSLLKKYPLLVLIVLAYGAGLVLFLLPKLGNLTVPVIVYATLICTMLLYSLHIFYTINRPSAVLYVSGAVFFVLSDSLLAINKFYQPFTGAGVGIMLTYCAAQFCIVRAFIVQR